MRKRLEGKSVKTAYLGLLLALAVIFGYIEALIPVPVPIPGIKLGLANLVIAAVLYFYGPFEAMTVTVLRVLIIGFLFGNMFSIVYSTVVSSGPHAGGACSRYPGGAGRQDRTSAHLCGGRLLRSGGESLRTGRRRMTLR